MFSLLHASPALSVLTLATAQSVGPDSVRHASPAVEPEVWGELARSADGRAYVIVVLDPVAGHLLADPEEAREAIAVREELVLAGMSADEFQVAYCFRNFPALTDLEGVPALDESPTFAPCCRKCMAPGRRRFVTR